MPALLLSRDILTPKLLNEGNILPILALTRLSPAFSDNILSGRFPWDPDFSKVLVQQCDAMIRDVLRGLFVTCFAFLWSL